jgi:hypothetical protein
MAVAYITPVVTTMVNLCLNVNPTGFTVSNYKGSITTLNNWVAIEVVYKNALPSSFLGATASASGSFGLVPAPTASQYNYALTGSGGWTKLGLGITGEVWNNVTTSRGVTTNPKPGPQYTNDLKYPIMIAVGYTSSSADGFCDLYVGGACVVRSTGITGAPGTTGAPGNVITAIVPPGAGYSAGCRNTATYNTWYELY